MTAVVRVVFTSCPTRGGQQRNQFNSLGQFRMSAVFGNLTEFYVVDCILVKNQRDYHGHVFQVL